MGTQEFLGKRWLLIIAHPDDESYLFAGSIHENWKAGGSCVIACATHGGKGGSHLPKKIPAKSLARIREAELHRASQVLHVADVHLQNIPDCECTYHRHRFFSFCQDIARRSSPDVVVGFWKEGFTGHRDHIAAYTVARRLAKKFHLPMYGAAMSPRLVPVAEALFSLRRKKGLYRTIDRYEKPTVALRVDARIKKRALACHASQLDKGKILQNFPSHAVRELLSREYFIRAK